MREKISAEDDFWKWSNMFHSAEGDMISAIKKLLTLEGFDFEEIRGVFTVHLYRECKYDEKQNPTSQAHATCDGNPSVSVRS